MKRTFVLGAAAAALTLCGIAAHAGCVDPRVMAGKATAKLPMVALPAPSTGSRVAADHDNGDRGIVGTWLVSYTTAGSPGGDAFIQWHDDGTEWENIDFPILGGNLCMGSWRPLDHHRVYRSHIGWLYTDGTLSGYFTETETNTVAHDGNSYSGTNDMKIYDLDGNLLVELPGTSQAVRLVP